MKQRTENAHSLRQAISPDQSGLTTRERAERLYRMGELEAAAELLMLEAIQ